MTDQIKTGDVVVLKSGGPKMTVSQVAKRPYGDALHAWCDWFIQDRSPWKKEEGVFPLTSLKVVQE